jgi:hypothetical protein
LIGQAAAVDPRLVPGVFNGDGFVFLGRAEALRAVPFGGLHNALASFKGLDP